MSDNKPFRDPCSDLTEKTKQQRIFQTEVGNIVCQMDKEKQKYRTLTVLDNDQKPIVVNYSFLSELKKQKSENDEN